MKKLLYITAVLITFASCITINTIFPSGSITTESRHVSSFNRVEVKGGIQLIAYNGEQDVLVETYENIHRHVEVFVKKNCLYIKPANHISFGGNTKIKVYVTNDIFDMIDASGGSKVIFPEKLVSESTTLNGSGGSQFEGEIECRNLALDIAGGGKADLYIDCATLKGQSSGGSIFTLEGIADQVDLNISGGGVMHGFYLDCYELYANLSGGSVANVTVSDNISANLSGGSKIKYKGYPNLQVDTSGGSKVINAN